MMIITIMIIIIINLHKAVVGQVRRELFLGLPEHTFVLLPFPLFFTSLFSSVLPSMLCLLLSGNGHIKNVGFLLV